MSRPLSVAMVAACPFPYPRGTPIRAHRIAEALAGMGVQVRVVTYHLGDRTEPLPFEVHRIRRIPTFNCAEPGPSLQKLLLADPLLASELRRVLMQSRIDLIHAHHYEGLAAALVARRGTGHPVIYDAHVLLESELPSYRLGTPQSLKRRIGRRIDRWLPRRADYVISVSERIREKLIRECRVPAGRIEVVPSGVESHFFRERAQSGSRRNGNSTLIFAGTLAPYQRIDLLLRSFREVLDRRPTTRLRIVSDSPFAEYEPLAADLGIRSQIDLRSADFEQLPRLLKDSDVAVSPRTDCSGLPQKLLNYMAAGIPIVSFEGSAPMIRNGDNGWVVQNGDVSAFADGVLHLLGNPDFAARLGANAEKLARTQFNWSVIADRVRGTYERVLDGVKRVAP